MSAPGGYDRRLVEQLLPAVWDPEYAYGMRNPQAPDPDMPKGTVDKKKGSALFAHLADIRMAWGRAEVPQVERQALLLAYGLDMGQKEAAKLCGVTQRAISYRCERGVGRITAWLNGEQYVDGYDGQTPEPDV